MNLGKIVLLAIALGAADARARQADLQLPGLVMTPPPRSSPSPFALPTAAPKGMKRNGADEQTQQPGQVPDPREGNVPGTGTSMPGKPGNVFGTMGRPQQGR